MAPNDSSLDRVIAGFGYAFPAAVLAAAMNILLADTAFFLCGVFGRRLPSRVRHGLFTAVGLANCAGGGVAYVLITRSCASSNLCATPPSAACVQSVGLTTLWLFATSWADRLVLPFVGETKTTLVSRFKSEAGLLLAWLAISENDATAPLLASVLAVRRMRFFLPRLTRAFVILLNLTVFAVGVRSLCDKDGSCVAISKKSAVGAILLAFTVPTR